MIYLPRVGEDLTVTLPSEQMRAKVTRVVDRHTVIVQIGQPMMRTHNFRKDDFVGCRRKAGVLGEYWEAIEVRATLPDLPIGKLPKSGPLLPEQKPPVQKAASTQKQAGFGHKTTKKVSKKGKTA